MLNIVAKSQSEKPLFNRVVLCTNFIELYKMVSVYKQVTFVLVLYNDTFV